jgi:hypothetical protein
MLAGRISKLILAVALTLTALAVEAFAQPQSNVYTYSPEFSHPGPGRISFDGLEDVGCTFCSQGLRTVTTFTLNGLPTPSRDAAALVIRNSFAPVATQVLQPFIKTTPVGWEDLPDTICRAYSRNKSLVLPAPYFDDVEYCVRLTVERLEGGLSFQIRVEAHVTLTKNGSSTYREADQDELVSYGKAIVEIAKKVVAGTRDKLIKAGWSVKEDGSVVSN